VFHELPTTSLAIVGATGGAAVASAAIYWVARRRQDDRASALFGRFALVVAIWNGFSVATFLAHGRLPVILLEAAEGTVALVATFVWAEFVVHYTGHSEWLTRRRRALLWLEPAIYVVWLLGRLVSPSYLAAATVRRVDGLAYVAHDVSSTLTLVWFGVPLVVALASYLLLGRFILRTRGGYRKQAATIFSAGFFVYVGIVVSFSTTNGSTLSFDPTPALNAWMVLVVGVALFKMDFLEVMPLATNQLFEEIPDPVFLVTPGGDIYDANDAATSLVGDVPSNAALSTTAPALAGALDDGDERVAIETEDGDERVYALNVSPLEGPRNRQRGRLVVLRDVTPQVEREWQLERQNERLDRFASVVSHDLRNPLNVAHGFAEQASETGELAHLDRSMDAMADMERLIDDVLTLARQGRTVDDTMSVDLATVARDAWPFVDAEASLRVESTATLSADADRLAELLGNCYRNAREHCDDGDVTIWVGATDDGFYVEDDGPGIPADERETVFDSGYTTADSGTGLGLAIVANIAEAHGWRIDATAGRAGGAKFVVSAATVRDRRPLTGPDGEDSDRNVMEST